MCIKSIDYYYQLILCVLIFPTAKDLKISFNENLVNIKYKERSFTDPSNKNNYQYMGDIYILRPYYEIKIEICKFKTEIEYLDP